MNFSFIAANTNRSYEYLKIFKKLKILPKQVFYYSENKKIKKNKIIKILNNQKINWKRFFCKSVNNENISKEILKSRYKRFIFSGFPGEKVQSKLLNKKELIHCHPGFLPKFRGSTTIYYSLIINKNIYCTVFKMSKKIDFGKIYLRKKFKRPKNIQEINSSFDDKIRASTIGEFLKINKSKIKKVTLKNNNSNEYFIAHPVIRALAINKKYLKFIKNFK